MKLNRTGSIWNRNERNKINDNWDKLEGNVNDFQNEITDKVFTEIKDSAKLNWGTPVNNFSELPSNSKEGDTRFTRDTGKVYRYDGKNWIEIQEIDASPVNEVDSRLSSQLAQTGEKIERVANADLPLFIKTYEGYNQAVHPDVLYFKNGWNGYKYWMSYTPYPWTNDFYENPSIAVSNDGIEWKTPTGLTNPLDEVTQEENDNGIHLSDAVLVYRADTNILECWWRWTNETTREEKFYRRTTNDGKNWTQKELVYKKNDILVSPSIRFENGKYKMWAVASYENYKIVYTETPTPTTLTSWTNEVVTPVSFADGERQGDIWHIHIYKESPNKYHVVFNEKTGSIFWATSSNGMLFENGKEILKASNGEGRWDNIHLYRASLVKVDNLYRLYYSALGLSPGRWYIGLTEGESLETLKGTNNINNSGYVITTRTKGELAEYDQFRVNDVIFRNEGDKPPRVRLLHSGKYGAEFELIGVDTLQLNKDNKSKAGHLKVATLILAGEGEVAEKGGIRYNSVLKKFQGLDGSYWHNLNNYRPTPPTSWDAGGTTGDYAVDSNYLYVCYGGGRWIRIPGEINW